MGTWCDAPVCNLDQQVLEDGLSFLCLDLGLIVAISHPAVAARLDEGAVYLEPAAVDTTCNFQQGVLRQPLLPPGGREDGDDRQLVVHRVVCAS